MASCAMAVMKRGKTFEVVRVSGTAGTVAAGADAADDSSVFRPPQLKRPDTRGTSASPGTGRYRAGVAAMPAGDARR